MQQHCIGIGRDNADILPKCVVMNQTFGILVDLLFIGKNVLMVKQDHMIVYCCYFLSKELLHYL